MHDQDRALGAWPDRGMIGREADRPLRRYMRRARPVASLHTSFTHSFLAWGKEQRAGSCDNGLVEIVEDVDEKPRILPV